jgi:hypothetical protein
VKRFASTSDLRRRPARPRGSHQPHPAAHRRRHVLNSRRERPQRSARIGPSLRSSREGQHAGRQNRCSTFPRGYPRYSQRVGEPRAPKYATLGWPSMQQFELSQHVAAPDRVFAFYTRPRVGWGAGPASKRSCCASGRSAAERPPARFGSFASAAWRSGRNHRLRPRRRA